MKEHKNCSTGWWRDWTSFRASMPRGGARPRPIAKPFKAEPWKTSTRNDAPAAAPKNGGRMRWTFLMSIRDCIPMLRRWIAKGEDAVDPVVRSPLVRLLWAGLVASGTIMAMMAGYIFWEIKGDIDDLPQQIAVVATEVRSLNRTVTDGQASAAVAQERIRAHDERLRMVEDQLRALTGFRVRE